MVVIDIEQKEKEIVYNVLLQTNIKGIDAKMFYKIIEKFKNGV